MATPKVNIMSKSPSQASRKMKIPQGMFTPPSAAQCWATVQKLALGQCCNMVGLYRVCWDVSLNLNHGNNIYIPCSE